ncbi:MAG: hypothetical protein AAGB13_03500 [Cyanobacteria bacterium P01_F01_bin.33]
MSEAASAPRTDYSKPESGLFCIFFPGGQLVANSQGQACCFESEEEAQKFLATHPELGGEPLVQEVVVQGNIHGWEKVPPDDVEEKSIRNTSS